MDKELKEMLKVHFETLSEYYRECRYILRLFITIYFSM